MSPTAGHDQTRPEVRFEADATIHHVTCLGCGCACEDIGVRVRHARIVEAANACGLGRAWFSDGVVPTTVRVDNADAGLDAAVDAVVAMLASANRPLIYLAPEVSCEAQREVVALADLLRASLDTVSSDTVLSS